MTVNELVGEMAERAAYLIDTHTLKGLRFLHPDGDDSKAVKSLTRGECINAILLDEFSLEFDKEIEA